LKIAFDFHGVLQTYPEILKPILISLNKEHNLIILSGPPWKEIFVELTDAGYTLGTHYDEIISVVDWIKEQGIPMHQNENESWYCDDESWWSSKAKICKQNHISVLVDDKIQYKEHIENNFPLFFHVK
jgi:hypothetical protein